MLSILIIYLKVFVCKDTNRNTPDTRAERDSRFKITHGRICNNLLGTIQSFAASSKSTAEIVRTPFGVCSSIAKETGPLDTVIPPRPCPQRPDKIYVYFETANG